MCNSMVLQLKMMAEYPHSANHSIHATFEELIDFFLYYVRLSDPTSSWHHSFFENLDKANRTRFRFLRS